MQKELQRYMLDERSESTGYSSLRWSYLLGILLIGLLIRLLLAFDHSHFFPLIDDSYYSLSIARNIAAGKGLSYSGYATNGFQPLFVFLAVPFYWVFGFDSNLAIHAILAFMAAINCLTGYFLYRFLHQLQAPIGAIVSLAIWSFSPYIIWQGMNGLETPLTAFFLVVSGGYYLRNIRSVKAPSIKQLIFLGVLLGLGALSRIDMGFWAAAIAIDFVFSARSQELQSRIKSVALVTIAATLIAMPWFYYNLKISGSPLPTSGQAVRFISLAYGYKLGEYDYFPEDSIPFQYYRRSLNQSARRIVDSLDVLNTLFINYRYQGALLVGIVTLGTLHRTIWQNAFKHTFLITYPLAIVAAYSFWIFGQWFYSRYYYGVVTVLIIWISIVIQTLSEHISLTRRTITFLLAVIAIILLFFASDSIPQIYIRGQFRSVEPALQISRWIQENVPPEDKVGLFQSGITEYYTTRPRIINLDGVVNSRALAAMRASRMSEYLREEDIDWLIDWDWVVDALYVRKSGVADPLSEWEVVESSKWILMSPPHPVKFYKRVNSLDQK